MDEYEDIIGSLENEEEIIGGEVLDDEETTGEMTDDQFDMSLTNNHALLSNRSAPNQHPIGSITGLEDALAAAADNAEVMSLINALTGEIAGKVADAEFDDDGLFYFLDSYGERIAGPFEGFKGIGGGGGGGGSSNNAVLTVTNTSGWLATTVAEGAEVAILLNWSSLEDELETGSGTVTVYVNGANKASLNVQQGDISIDVTNYLVSGTNNVRLRVSDAYGNIKTIQFTINVAALSIESSFDATTVYSDAISFPFVPKGNVSKTIYFEIDGTLDGTMENVTASNRQLSYSIPSLSHGEHILRVWFEAEVNGETVSSNVLRYSIVFAGQTGNPVISSDFNRATVQQYESVPIRYQVYNPTSMSQEITIAVNGTVVSTQTVDRTLQTYTFRADNTGAVAITITAGVTTKTISFTVAEGEYTIEAETEALELYLSPNGRSNNESTKNTWAYGNVSATMTGFNFASDGWLTDEKDVDILRVTGDARVTIPFQPFASDFRTGGKTIELDFLVRDVRDYDAVIMSCMSGNRGFELTAQKATMKSAQTEIFTQYKEEEHVRIAFVVEKRSENRLVYIYINGIMSGVVQYPSDDDFAQVTPVNISIGSSYCTTDIYGIRIYNNDLTRHQIVTNWIADTQDVEEKVARYTHNNVYNEYAEVTISDLPNDLPYLVIRGTLPTYKGDKKTVSGYYTDPQSAAKSFTYENAQIDVQGTSSQYYSRKNYKIKFNGGFTINGETQSKYQMRSNSVPTKTFCMKADVASSEGANNVELARRYEAACPYKTPPQIENPQVRQGIDGFPIVIFHDDGENIRFIGKYNWNNDKSTEEVFGFSTGDESWETLNNTSDRVIYKSADFTGDGWLNDFEARYPDTDPAYTNKTKLSAFAAWVVSTDRDAVQSAADKATRLAKFKSELADHANVDSALFYYIFTELFLMVDSRAKNSFPTRYNAEGKWIWLPYDLDTALGINNEGSLVFGYELEDTDLLPGGAKVFNGQDSTFWCNIRDAYADEIRTMYQTLRSTGALSYEVVENAFKEHQSKWPEAIFNEDAYVKYIEPLITEGNGVYLAMCQGSKEQQREWWLYNRFRYMDSKYNAGEALSKYITVRGYAKDDITVTPYAHIYAAAKFGSYLVQERAIRGGDYTLECPLDNVNDTEIMIFSADQLASVGDLSGLKVGFADFSMGTKLQSIKVGDGDSEYENPNLTELYVGNNTLLKEVDARNCTALTGSVDLSGCTNVEEVYMEGTALTGLQLPNGGALKKLHLPDTITNLTIRNQPGITEFEMPDYSNISTLWLENAGSEVDALAILADIAPGSRVRIIGLDLSVSGESSIANLYDLLDTMRGLDEQGGNMAKAQVSGTIRVSYINSSSLEDFTARYPSINIVYTNIQYLVKFWSYDGSRSYGSVSSSSGGTVSYPLWWETTPTRPPEGAYAYTLAGWALLPNQTVADPDALTNVTADRNVYAVFSVTERTYTQESWHQCPQAVQNFVDNVDYTNVAYTESSISTYAPATPVLSNTKPVGKTVDGMTFYNEVPLEETPFGTENEYGTVQPLDQVRWINSTATNNFRDIGGWACDGGTTKYGLIYRSGDMGAADEDLIINQLGIKTEVDLTADDDPAYGDEMEFVCPSSTIMYSLSNTTAWTENLRGVFGSIMKGDPVIIHCSMGADRTATLVCVLQGLLGVSQSDIDKEYELTSFYALRARNGNYQGGGNTDWAHLMSAINALSGATFRDKCVGFVLSLGFTIGDINTYRAAMIDGTPTVLTDPNVSENLFESAEAETGTRLNSAGSAVSYVSGQLVTGFIDAIAGDVIYVESDIGQFANGYTGMISAYDSSGNHLGQLTNATPWVWNTARTKGYIVIPNRVYNGDDYSTTAKIKLCIAYSNQANIVINRLLLPPSLT